MTLKIAAIALALPWAAASAQADPRETCFESFPSLRIQGAIACQLPPTPRGDGTLEAHSLVFLQTPGDGSTKTLTYAGHGDTAAMVRLSHFYRLAGSLETALSWAHKAAVAGDAEAQYDLAQVDISGLTGAADPRGGVAILRRLADKGYAPAMAALGSAYGVGSGVPKDDTVATSWFRRAAEHGSVGAMVTMGMRYQGGNGVARDEEQAVGWLERAYQSGDTMEASTLARIYNGEVGKDREAAKWNLIAAKAGDPYAMRMLVEMYANGRGVPKDPTQANYWATQEELHPAPPLLIRPVSSQPGPNRPTTEEGHQNPVLPAPLPLGWPQPK